MPPLAQIESLLHEALSLPPGVDPAAWVEERCRHDPELSREVLSLLDAREEMQRASAEPAPPCVIPTAEFGAYRAVELLGRGGMSAVFVAKRADGQFDQTVALKIMAGYLLSPEFLRRFDSERRILASLHHHHITRLLDGGVSSAGDPYLITELVDGAAIDVYCDGRKLDVKARLRIFLQVCDAVGYAHRCLIVHRDLKPANILVNGDGMAKLLDFGTASMLANDDHVTITRMRMLTPRYASPEQLRGERVNTSTDVFSLGVILYELLTGSWPFGDPNSLLRGIDRSTGRVAAKSPSAAVTGDAAASRALSRDQLVRALKGDLSAIALRALEHDPARRYASVREMAEDIESFLDERPVRARPQTFWYRTGKFLRRHVWQTAFSAVTVCSLAGATVYSTYKAHVADIQSRTSLEVSHLMQEMLSPAESALGGSGKEIRLIDVLDAAVGSLDHNTIAQPEVEARMRRFIGNSYRHLNEFDKATPQHRRDLDLQRRMHSGDDPEIALAFTDLVQAEHGSRIAPVREQAYQDAATVVQIWRRLGTRGEPKPYFDALYLWDAELETHRQFSPAAEADLREGVELSGRIYGPRSKEALRIHRLFGNWYLASGDPVHAEGEHRTAREIAAPLIAGDKLMFRQNWNDEINYQSNRVKARVAYGERDLRAMIDSVRDQPARKWELAFSELRLAQAYMYLKQPALAEPLFRDASAMFNRIFEGDVTWRAAGFTFLGKCLLAEGKAGEAVPVLQQAYELALRINGPRGENTAEVRKDLDAAQALLRGRP